MERVPAILRKGFCFFVSAFLLSSHLSILQAATSRNQKKMHPAQVNKSAPPKAMQKRGEKAQRQRPAKPVQKMRRSGLNHIVKKGETLFGISRAYHVLIDTLIKANSLSKPSALRVGQRLFIPGAQMARKVKPFKPLSARQRLEMVRSLETQDTEELIAPGSVQGYYLSWDPLKEISIPSLAEKEGEERASSGEDSRAAASGASSDVTSTRIAKPDSEGFVWPLINRVTSRFGLRGKRMHTGIDIAAPSYHEVVAAADGEVIYVQHSRRGLGNAVVLEHDNGYRTLYGHGVVILVKEGETVKRGQPIMGVGNTGHSTGSHLHFEIRKDGVPIDPLRLMPPTLDELIEDLRVEKKSEGPS